ncbi:DoxX family protein [Mesorhizobium sp. 10J20-29]
MTAIHEMPMSENAGRVGWYRRLLQAADAIPLSLVQLAGRLAVAHVFWQSAQTKLVSWPVTIQLFTFEYNLPLIDPAVAALLGTAAEVAGALLIFFGLFSRLGALVLLGVTATIQIFVYPQNWGEHLLWATVLLLLFSRGAGVVSLDHLAARQLARQR